MNRIVLDTETANNQFDDKGRNIKNTALVYDFGFAVVDEKENTLEERSYVIKEIFFGMADVMQSAYYANKIPKYLNDIISGNRTVVSFWDAKKDFIALVNKYNVIDVMAHNAWFDFGALNTTMKYLSKSKYKYFFPKNMRILDTMRMCREVLSNNADYINWCALNGFLDKRELPRKTAEIVYRYISNNIDFVESHTGLEDVNIEKEIYFYCLKNQCSLINILDKYKNDFVSTPLQKEIIKNIKYPKITP